MPRYLQLETVETWTISLNLQKRGLNALYVHFNDTVVDNIRMNPNGYASMDNNYWSTSNIYIQNTKGGMMNRKDNAEHTDD